MGSLVAIASEDLFYVLHVDRDAYAAKDDGVEITDRGVEEALDVAEIPDA